MRTFFAASIAIMCLTGAANAQVGLDTYANKDGYILVQKITCAQLAGTYQDDANFLGIWYSGWYNGLAKKNAVNMPRVKENIHNVIVYCQANPTKRVIDAIAVAIKKEQEAK